MARLHEHVRPPDDAVLGAVASAAAPAGRVVREVHVASLREREFERESEWRNG